MGLIDKIKDFMAVPDEDDFDNDIYEEYNNPAPELKKSKPVKESKLVEFSQSSSAGGAVPLQVVLVKPDAFDDASEIADHLNAKRTVVLNLESTSKEVSRRLLDFLSGVAYANNGEIKRVANSTFIITPYNVNVMGDLIDDIGNSGIF